MQLKAIRVQNFRCIEDATLQLDDLTQIVGPNGSGKSTFLAALQWFYNGPSTPSSDDFYNREHDRDIEIGLTYALESTDVSEDLKIYVDDDGELTVSLRVQAIDDDTNGAPLRFHFAWIGYPSSHDPFNSIRALPRKPERTEALKGLLASHAFDYEFVADTAWDRSDELMHAWERDHPDNCSRSPDTGEFFSAPQAGGPLHGLTTLVSVPALHDTSGESEATQRNLIGQLAALIVGDPMDSNAMRDLADDVNQRLVTIVKEEGTARLPRLEESVNAVLKRYVPGAGVRIGYRPQAVVLPRPMLYVQVTDRGFEGDLERKGHGLQRLYVVSLLDAAANVQINGEDRSHTDEAAQGQAHKHQLLTIEEPELYQHPIQARRFAKVLSPDPPNPRPDSAAGTRKQVPL